MVGDPEEAGREAGADVGVYIQRADLLDDLGHHAEAAEELRDALRLEPDNPEALATLAMVQLRAGRCEQALASARAALAVAPEHLLGQVVRGYVLADLGRRAETVEAAEELLAVDRGSWLRQLHFAAIVRRVRNGQATLDAAWHAVELAPEEAETHLVLAAVAADLGLADVAARARAEAVRIDPRATDVDLVAPAGPRLRPSRFGSVPDEIKEPGPAPRSRSGVSRFLALGALYAWAGPLLAALMMLAGDDAARLAAGVAGAFGILLFGTARATVPDVPPGAPPGGTEPMATSGAGQRLGLGEPEPAIGHDDAPGTPAPGTSVPVLRLLGRLDRLLAAGCIAVLAAPAMLLVYALSGWAWPLGALILLGAFAFAALAVRATGGPRAGSA